ncbi:hypothetical protein Tco_0660732 [Tanacetum coccineum]
MSCSWLDWLKSPMLPASLAVKVSGGVEIVLLCFSSRIGTLWLLVLDEDEEIADLFGELHQSYEGVVFQINDQEEPKDLFVELDHVADLVVDEEVAEREKNVVDETEVKCLVGGGESIYGHVQIERQKREKKEGPKRFGRRRQLKMIVNDEFAKKG